MSGVSFWDVKTHRESSSDDVRAWELTKQSFWAHTMTWMLIGIIIGAAAGLAYVYLGF